MKIFVYAATIANLLFSGLIAPAQAYQKTVLCSSDNDCSGNVCVRSVCMTAQQLKHVAEVYVPKETLVRVQN